MGKDKLRKFRENETFKCLIQPSTSEVLNCDHPLKGNWGREVFGNDNPIVVELGCGKGDYTVDLAERNPSCNYIGVDIKGARLWKGAKYATEHALGNVAFLRTRIEFIESLFAENEISEIWITFADPQIGREKKRLTAPLFMNRYRNFLCKGGIIHLKTDSRYLHEYSLAMAQQNDLHILAAVEEESGSEASAQELKHLIGLVQAHNLTSLFTEINGSCSAAEVIARETGVKRFTLDMAMAGDDYFAAMYHNIQTIQEALQ